MIAMYLVSLCWAWSWLRILCVIIHKKITWSDNVSWQKLLLKNEFENTKEFCNSLVIMWGDINTNLELIKLHQESLLIWYLSTLETILGILPWGQSIRVSIKKNENARKLWCCEKIKYQKWIPPKHLNVFRGITIHIQES